MKVLSRWRLLKFVSSPVPSSILPFRPFFPLRFERPRETSAISGVASRLRESERGESQNVLTPRSERVEVPALMVAID